jgi:hypothetical protein
MHAIKAQHAAAFVHTAVICVFMQLPGIALDQIGLDDRRETDGDFTLTAGEWYGDAEADQGIQTGPARFFASYSELPAAFSNEGKDLVVQVRESHRR